MKRENRESIDLKPRDYDVKGLPERFFSQGELVRLLHLYEQENPKVVVEFGVHRGRNAVAALRNIKSIERYIGVDVAIDYQTQMTVQRNEVPEHAGDLAKDLPQFEVIVRPNGTFDLSPDDLPRCDVVFIDADHSRKGVMNDRALALDILKKGGLIIYHDDNCLDVVEVTQTLNDLCKEGAKMVHVNDTWLTYERIE